MIVIETRDLTIGYKTKTIHSHLNLQLREADLTSILGVNGSGKSTLIRTLCGFIPPLGGEIFIFGKLISSYTKEELSAILSVVLTERVSDGGLTVYEVVSMGRYPYTGFFGRLADRDREVIERSMQDVGVWAMRDLFISELSDGERQKVMIAKSLAQESKIIILDEPTSFLDLRSRMEIISLLRRLAREKGMTFLLSLHDLELSLQYSDSLWIMSCGSGVECGQTESMVLSGAINRAAGGGLLFDVEAGVFRQHHNGIKRVRYEGADLLWVRSALTRVGYCFCDDERELVIRVTDYQNIEVFRSGEKIRCHSIAEMLTVV
ncbi:MAG: ABC transporter ATP-binding protein [Rikenellaceae bacterium]